jgi:hypothetical protein
VSRSINFGKGSKRLVRLVRWKPVELITAILFLLGALIFCLLMGLWMASHSID